MKKIIVSFLVSLVCFFGYAQTPYPTPNPFGSKGTMTQAQGGWKIDSTAIMPVYADTFAANRSKTSLYAGSLIRVGDDYYYRSADTSKWLLLAITTSNCAGTQLISGSITWSGSGLVYDATDLDYYILCSRYFANSTTLTLAVADPTNPRIDKFYADITGAIGVITGTPATNPQEPQVNPLTQIDLGFVYIPAGSTVPAGTTQTVIYNENVEWTGTSDVPSINFAYATNPYIGSLSTYLPSAPYSSYVEWQSNGIDYLFSEAQYLKFWVRLNANFTVDPLSFLDVTFEYTDVTVSQTLAVGNGDYNMDYSLINQWQLVSIPLTGITTFGTEFNSVHFVINSAPTSFQLDYVYLLETATIPPVISSGWSLNLNTGTNPTTNGIGTSDSVGVAIKTNSETRAIMPANGLQLVDDTTYRVMVWNETTKEWAVTYQPTILADSPLVIYQDVYQRHIKADTTRRGAALATQYYADSVANAGGGTPTWQQTLTAGSVITSNINSTSPTGRRFIFKTDAVLDSRFTRLFIDTVQTSLSHYSATYGTSGLTITNDTVASVFYTTSSLANAQSGASKSYSFLNYWNNVAGSVDSIKTLGVDNNGAFFSYNNQRYTFPLIQPTTGQYLGYNGDTRLEWVTPSGGTPAGNYGNIQINRNGVFETPGSDSLSFTAESLNVIGGIHVSDAVGAETPAPSYIKTTNDLLLGDVTNGVYAQISGSNADNILRLYSTGGNPMELHDDVTVIGNITAHNIIGATATQTDANFSATAGTAYVLSGNNSATRTITMPTLAEGDIFEFYNENTSANKWVSSATIYLSDNTTFTTLADDTNYILRYVGGKLRVSN